MGNGIFEKRTRKFFPYCIPVYLTRIGIPNLRKRMKPTYEEATFQISIPKKNSRFRLTGQSITTTELMVF